MNAERIRRTVPGWVVLAAGLLVGAALLLIAPIQAAGAEGAAHVVVAYADGRVAVRPITWTAPISRVAALTRAGLAVEHDGDAICSIGGEGCPAGDCFCADNRWAQAEWDGRAWDGSEWPPANLQDGDVIAFRNGSQPDYSDWGVEGKLPAAPAYVAVSRALEWMRAEQRADGSYDDGLGSIGASARALVAVGSAGYDPAEWGEPSLLDFLTVVSQTATVDYAASSAAAAGKLALAAAWAGQPVTDFAGINLPISITAFYDAETGAYGNGSGDTAWAILGLFAAGEAVPVEAAQFLLDVQNPDGGWAWNEWGVTSEVQHTAACLQALVAAGVPVTATEVTDALAYLATARNADGGYPYAPPGDSDPNTSAYVVQTLLSAGGEAPGNWCSAVGLSYLLAAQEPDGGYPGYSPLYATQEVIPALMHRAYGPVADWTYACFGACLPVVSRSEG